MAYGGATETKRSAGGLTHPHWPAIPSKIVSRAVHASVTGICSLIGWLVVGGENNKHPPRLGNRDDLSIEFEYL